MHQRIEDVRSLAGQTATLSFYARRPSGSTTINARIVQYFGTGGSPSSTVVTSLGTVNLTTDWQKFTFTVSVPSISGKTLGTDNNSSLWVGVQITDTNTGTIDFAQIQFEVGDTATPFEHRPFDMELARCQRYYEKSYAVTTAPAGSDYYIQQVNPLNRGGGTGAVGYPIYYKVTKRANPTVTPYTYDGTSGQWHTGVIGSSEAKGNATIEDAGTNFFKVVVLYSTAPNAIYGHWVSSSEL